MAPAAGDADIEYSTVTKSLRIELRTARVDDASILLGIINAAFQARLPVDPPAEALSETVETLAQLITSGTGLIAELDGEPVGGLVISRTGDRIGLHRVGVIPSARGKGVATELVRGAALIGVEQGARTVQLFARAEFPELLQWWGTHGFEVEQELPNGYLLSRSLPKRIMVPTASAMQDLGRRVAAHAQPGDVIVESGDLGAGKTTFTQGIGAGLGIEGPVTSPTFVLSRVHPNPGGGPALVHVDAYRLGSAAELEDIDLETSLADSVTIIEWGAGISEWLSDNRLEIDILRGDDPNDETREVYLTGYGRWNQELEAL